MGVVYRAYNFQLSTFKIKLAIGGQGVVECRIQYGTVRTRYAQEYFFNDDVGSGAECGCCRGVSGHGTGQGRGHEGGEHLYAEE